MSEKILVTGATGFVGSNLVEALLGRGLSVRVLKRSVSSPLALSGLDVEQMEGDIRDLDSVQKAVQGCDIVFHCAGYISFEERKRKYQEEVNVQGTLNVAKACKKYGVKRLIYTSTVNAIGYPETGLGNEDIPFNYSSGKFCYCETKKDAEDVLAEEFHRGLPVVIVNPGTMFGPRDVYLQAGRMIVQMARGNVFGFIAGGSSFCNVRDVVEGHIQAWKRGRLGERYILAGENLSYEQIFKVIARKLNRTPPRVRLPRQATSLAGMFIEWGSNALGKDPPFTRTMARFWGIHNYFSSEKAGEELGYHPKSCGIGIDEAIEWYRDHGFI